MTIDKSYYFGADDRDRTKAIENSIHTRVPLAIAYVIQAV